MTPIVKASLPVAISVLLVASLAGADAGNSADPMMAMPDAATAATPGLKVGEKAPDFTLKNAAGKDVALHDLLKTGKVAILFYRSGDWCPFCQAELKDLQKNIKDIEATGVQFIGISYDSPETLGKVTAKFNLTYPLLSDPGSKTIDAYGIRNQEATGKAVGTPHPTIFILDSQGVIRVKLAHDGVQIRPAPAEIIAGVKSIK